MSLEPALPGEPVAGAAKDGPDAILVMAALLLLAGLLVGGDELAAKSELLLRCRCSLLKGERTIGRRNEEEENGLLIVLY